MTKLGRLSDALKSFYTRKGKFTFFSNGSTLNKLAFDMWEHPGGRSVDASVISRVLTGERLFTETQLRLFCSILQLSRVDTDRLLLALKYDILGKGDADTSATVITDLEFLHTAVEMAGNLRKASLPHLVISWVDRLERLIDTIPHRQPAVMELLGQAYQEKIMAVCETMPVPEINIEVKNIFPKFSAISRMSGNSHYLGIGLQAVGDTHYFARDYSLAFQYYTRSRSLLTPFSDVHMVNLRNTAICLAGTRDRSGLDDFAGHLLHIRDRIPASKHFPVYESLARSYSMAGQQYQSRKYLEEASRIYENHALSHNTYRLRRGIQLRTTAVSVLKGDHPGRHSQEISRNINEILTLSRQLGSRRWEQSALSMQSELGSPVTRSSY